MGEKVTFDLTTEGVSDTTTMGFWGTRPFSYSAINVDDIAPELLGRGGNNPVENDAWQSLVEWFATLNVGAWIGIGVAAFALSVLLVYEIQGNIRHCCNEDYKHRSCCGGFID